MRRFLILAVLLILILPEVRSQSDNKVSVHTVPLGSIPLGSSTDLFNLGAGVEAAAIFTPGLFRFLGLKVGSTFLSLPLNSPDTAHSIWTVSCFGGPFFRYPLGSRFSVYAEVMAGYYYWGSGGWDAGESAGGGLVAGGSLGALYRIVGAFTLGTGVSYDYYSKLYNGLSVELSMSLDFPGLEKESGTLKLHDLRLLPLFPVLYSYYSKNPVGSVRVLNTGAAQVNNITVQFYVEQYMNNPMKIGGVFSLEPGEERQIELYALFTDALMEITEGTKTSAKITVIYSGKKNTFTEDLVGVLDFYNRNAMTWEDDRKISSFITSKDPEIMNFAKNVVTWMQDVKNPAVDENLQKAIALFEAIKAFGIRYEIDPVTPFSDFSENTGAIDYLQFPRQTLRYTNGDCDDLTVLYASLLEAVGIESGFITVPGHIYAAFALKSLPEEAEKTFSRPQDLIFLDGKVWLPLEITMFQESFEKAWVMGAKQWHEHNSIEQAILYPTRDAWNTYPAVGFREGEAGISLPERKGVTNAIDTAINRYVEREIFSQVSGLKTRVDQSPGDLKNRNKLALVYARYGRYEQALGALNEIFKRKEYAPALINAANIYYLQGNLQIALNFYNRALAQNGTQKTALLGAARCNYEMENYGLVKQAYEQIKEIDPLMADRFAYLDLRNDDSARASGVTNLRNTVVWEDQE